MKYLLLILMMLLVNEAIAQNNGVRVTVKAKSITVNLEDDNSDKIITIDTKAKWALTTNMYITNTNWNKEKDWKRSFEIFNSSDQSVFKFKNKSCGKYEVALKNLTSKLSKGETYSLYTIAIPKDPKKAAVVRVRRVLVCRITIA